MTTLFISRTTGRHAWNDPVLAALLLVVAAATQVACAAEDWSEQSAIDAQGVGYDHLGAAVALAGNVALVAAPNAAAGDNDNQGKVLAYGRSGGNWNLAQTLTASDGAAYNGFGQSVAVSGNTAVVGATNAKIGTNNSQGAAYVFTQSDGAWGQTQKLVAADGRAVDWFGNAVAVADDMIVVAAYGAHYNDQMGRGSVYVFTPVGGVWTQTQQLVASDGMGGDEFGYAIARSGANLFISSPGATVNGNYAQGAVYRFALSGNVWSEAQKITIADGVESDQLGTALAVDGATLLIGERWRNGQHGAVYVFDGSFAGSWTPVQTLVAPDVNPYVTPDFGLPPSDYYGSAIALQNGTALIGAGKVAIEGNTAQGAAYLYRQVSGEFANVNRFTKYEGVSAPYIGSAVALDEDDALVGAIGYSPDWNNVEQGIAYFYHYADVGIPASERAALIDLYDSTDGATAWGDTTNWLGAPGTECTWSGVSCNDTGTHVTGLSFDWANLTGALPASLNQLTYLTNLQLADDSPLSGVLPPLTRITGLQFININATSINGRLPSLAGLWNLQAATFQSNQFDGPIPPFGTLPNLGWFAVSANQLSGRIPPLAGLTGLNGFFVDSNQLGGTPPAPPASLGAFGAALCPNAFDHVESAPWDTITGTTPWYRDCTATPDAIFADGFDGATP